MKTDELCFIIGEEIKTGKPLPDKHENVIFEDPNEDSI
jgi:hypothetical protein